MSRDTYLPGNLQFTSGKYEMNRRLSLASDFSTSGIPSRVSSALSAAGFDEPTEVQSLVLPVICSGSDVVMQSPSGTGKTLAYLSAVLAQVNPKLQKVQAIVLCPTTELASQVKQVAVSVCRSAGLVCCTARQRPTSKSLDSTPQVLIGAPGVVLSMLRSCVVDGAHVKALILDEFDELLSKGLRPLIKSIRRRVSDEAQVVLSSASLPKQWESVIEELKLKSPLIVRPKAASTVPDLISNFYVDVDTEDRKAETLVDLLQTFSFPQVVVFCNSVDCATAVSKTLKAARVKCALAHGDLSLKERESLLEGVSSMSHPVLIATDMYGRGMDISTVSCVVLFDVPYSSSSMQHRIGRTGRNGRKGVSLALLTDTDREKFFGLVNELHCDSKPLPSDIAPFV